MSVTTKTVKEVYEALAKNGFQHLRGMWFKEFDDGGVGGCVLAQAAYNLGVVATDDDETGPFDFFESWNEPVYTLHSALANFQVDPKNRWYLEDTDNNVASHIIYWNDKEETDSDGESTGTYVIKTYQEVAQMAYELMEPYFDQTVKLTVYDYSPYFKVAS